MDEVAFVRNLLDLARKVAIVEHVGNMDARFIGYGIGRDIFPKIL